ncbi:unnamed protein product, partial [Vitis vinifera]
MADDVSCEGQEGQNLAPGGSPEEGHSLNLIKIQTGGGEEDYDTGKRRAVIMKTEVVCSSNSEGLRCSKAFKIQTRALLDEQDSDKNKTSNLKNDGSEGGVSEKNTGSEALCPVCSKSFRSKKAVYGHMRCHPDREWRGINPPPSAKSDSCSTESGSKNTTDRSKNGNKLDQKIVSESPLVAPREHKCSTCHKVFPTFQALGGHRSSHSYKNNLQAMDAGEEESKEGSSKVVVDGFKCNICSKNFRSGQALGGHKRAHFQGSTQATPTQDSASGKASESMGNKVLGFDLNELPRMDE